MTIVLYVFVQVEIEFANCYSSEWTWKRYPIVSDPASPLPDSSTLNTVNKCYVYWPTEDDIGHRLLVECTPASQKCTGTLATTISPVVTDGPGVNPITRCHLFTPSSDLQHSSWAIHINDICLWDSLPLLWPECIRHWLPTVSDCAWAAWLQCRRTVSPGGWSQDISEVHAPCHEG